MELLSPAGSVEKLAYAYQYGADAAYMGVAGFSLRANAHNASPADYPAIQTIKGSKKLYGALNLFAFDADLDRLRQFFDSHESFPFDAWVVSDLGSFRILRQYLPKAEVHLSTQANCLNADAAQMYYDLGFSRIVPGRELSLQGIAAIKNRVPQLELEVFVHGAMCMAYSGRCFLSAELTGRSANRGDCAHTCRWGFKALQQAPDFGGIVLEEQKRPGVYMPLFEDQGHMAIFSSRDLNMVRHLQSLKDAGVDSLKIEGRMKSLYYVAIVTKAYRQALNHLQGQCGIDEAEAAIAELEAVSHRPYSTGFFFDPSLMNQSCDESYESTHRFIGTIDSIIADPPPPLKPKAYASQEREPQTLIGTWYCHSLTLLNTVKLGMELEFVSPTGNGKISGDYFFTDLGGTILPQGVQQKEQLFFCRIALSPGVLLRTPALGKR
jgi:U32 family peptidase